MPYEKAVIMSGMEMFVNNFLAIVIAVTFVLIQNKRPVIGEINCELGSIQVCVMIIISIVIVLWSMLTTRNTLKERSPMNVLKDTAY
jgi:mannitol-specific phosphotransferase system IIBC component